MPYYGRKKACNSSGLRPVIKLVIFMKGCRARLHAFNGTICWAAESMVKLVENAVFCPKKYNKKKNKKNKAKLRPALYVRTNVGKNIYGLFIYSAKTRRPVKTRFRLE
jgi:hypothetical protein